MKEPKLNNLKLDKNGTKETRKAFAKNPKVRVTIHFDADLLTLVKKMAEQVGAPYQTLLNKILRDALLKKSSEESRLDKLEQELLKIKKKLAAKTTKPKREMQLRQYDKHQRR